MSWIEALSSTYDKCIDKTDISDAELLLPISHSTQNAQIEIVISEKGEFKSAKKIDDKERAVTIIPVTEDSAARSSGVTPHPLCDKLRYVAGDISEYIKDTDVKKYHEAYIDLLRDWCSSDYSHPKAEAVRTYVEKGTVVKDLLDHKILQLDESGILSDKLNKFQTTITQSEAFVRFSVETAGNRQDKPGVWEDESLMSQYIKYYSNTKSEESLCYATGEIVPCSTKHPSKIRNSGDKAKLLSGNDSRGFTYRGRFWEKEDSASVGYEASQKAHNALRWLIQRQGFAWGPATFAAWAVGEETKVPDLSADTDDLFKLVNIVPDESAEDTPSRAAKEPAGTYRTYAENLKKAMSGYYANLSIDNNPVVVMGVEAATTGRLSIIYYRQLEGSDFLKRIVDWHTGCAWQHLYKKEDGKYYTFIGAPAPREIALAAFGTEQNGLLKADDKLVAATVERLLQCIIDGRMVPLDIVRAVVNRASRPMAMSGFNWQKVLSISCSLVRMHRKQRYKEEEWNMALLETKDRNYRFGRLLAVAEYVERITYEPDEKRDPNAIRYWDRFDKKPAQTWALLQSKLNPYLSKLKKGAEEKYRSLITEILDGMEADGFSDMPLNHLYVLGYSSQRMAFKDNKKDNSEQKMEG